MGKDKAAKAAPAKAAKPPRMITKPINGKENGENRTVRVNRFVSMLYAYMSLSCYFVTFCCVRVHCTMYHQNLLDLKLCHLITSLWYLSDVVITALL